MTRPRLRALLAPYGSAGWAGVVAAVVGAALRVAVVPIFVGPVLDRAVVRGDLSTLPGIFLAAGAAVAGTSAAVLAQDALLARSGANLVARWREGLYRSLLARTPGRLPGTSGGLAGRILSDLREVETHHQYGLGTLATESAAVVGILGVLAWRAPGATAALVGLGLPTALLLAWLGRRLRGQADRAQEGTEAVAAHLQEGLRQHAVARAFGAEGFLLTRFGQANEATRRAARRRGLLYALQIPATQVAVFLALGGLVALLAGRAAAGEMTVGQVVEYLTLVALLSTPAQLLPRGYALLRQAEAAAARLLALERDAAPVAPAGVEHAEPAARPAATAPERDAGGPGLTLDDLWVRYDPDGPWVLAGASARLPARGLVALVGDSGAGKSTLLGVLLGFVHADRGQVRLEGAPLAARPGAIGWVPQSLDLMRGSVRDNLALGREVDDAAVWAAIRAVGMADAIGASPAGLDQLLDEDGAGLSGGQRQRLSIARALLGRPAVLLLDEPTANLDAAAEASLVTTLRAEARQRLVVAVAHRSALADAADLVLELADGGLRTVATAGAPVGEGRP